jgi:hypothetical protein
MKLARQDVYSYAHKHEHWAHDGRVQNYILESYTLSHLCDTVLVLCIHVQAFQTVCFD